MEKLNGIGWTGQTANIATGCTHVNALCDKCYMFREQLGRGNDPLVVKRTGKKTFYKPLNNPIPTVYFMCSYTDFFHPQIDSYRQDAWDMIEKSPQHIFQILTKRAGRIEKCLPPDWSTNPEKWSHVWLGVSVGGVESDKVMVKKLCENTASVLFLSVEPLIGSAESAILDFIAAPTQAKKWIIVGGESGDGNVPNDPNVTYGYRESEIEWFNEVVNACTHFGVPVFVKQLGVHLAKQLKAKTRTGKDINDLPENLRVRQFPINVSNHVCNNNL